MKLPNLLLAICVVASCSATDLQVHPAKATRFAEEFRTICLSHPRDSSGVRQAAAIRGIPVMETLKAGERAPPKSVWLNSWGEGVAWSCLLTQEDAENVVTARALTSALDQWADGAPIRWSPPKTRGRDQMPLLFFTSRQVGNDIHTVRANRLKADLVLYLEVKPGP